MKLFATVISLLAAGIVDLSHVHAQGSFQNLDFESVIQPLTADANFQVPAANALSGWTVYYGDYRSSQVSYNSMSIGAVNVGLLQSGGNFTAIQGQSMAVLQTGIGPGGIAAGYVNAAIGQIGTIPTSSHFVLLKAWGNTPSVTFNGQSVSLSILETGSSYILFAGDISQFGGQTGELKFGSYGNIYLDDIAFSTTSVPEPTTLALGLMGFGGLVGRRVFRAKK